MELSTGGINGIVYRRNKWNCLQDELMELSTGGINGIVYRRN